MAANPARPPADDRARTIRARNRALLFVLLGLVALRAGQGKRILYDGERGRITNIADANQYLTREYRAGWAI